MSNLIVDILCPNYEDRERLDLNAGASCYPEMWPIEHHAEAALYDERKAMAGRMFFMARNSVHRVLKYWRDYKVEDRARHRRLITYTLAQLARESGWTIKNIEDVVRKNVSPIYETRGRRRAESDEDDNNPCDEGIVIDIAALYHMMKEYYPDITSSPCPMPTKPKRLANRKDIQAYALAQLVAQSGWSEEKCGNNVYFFKAR